MGQPSLGPTGTSGPVAAAAAADLGTDEDANSRETVGASDAEADAARSGADTDLSDANRDTDGVPVGEADVEADAERGGADPTNL